MSQDERMSQKRLRSTVDGINLDDANLLQTSYTVQVSLKKRKADSPDNMDGEEVAARRSSRIQKLDENKRKIEEEKNQTEDDYLVEKQQKKFERAEARRTKAEAEAEAEAKAEANADEADPLQTRLENIHDMFIRYDEKLSKDLKDMYEELKNEKIILNVNLYKYNLETLTVALSQEIYAILKQEKNQEPELNLRKDLENVRKNKKKIEEYQTKLQDTLIASISTIYHLPQLDDETILPLMQELEKKEKELDAKYFDDIRELSALEVDALLHDLDTLTIRDGGKPKSKKSDKAKLKLKAEKEKAKLQAAKEKAKAKAEKKPKAKAPKKKSPKNPWA